MPRITKTSAKKYLRQLKAISMIAVDINNTKRMYTKQLKIYVEFKPTNVSDLDYKHGLKSSLKDWASELKQSKAVYKSLQLGLSILTGDCVNLIKSRHAFIYGTAKLKRKQTDSIIAAYITLREKSIIV